MGKVFIEEQNLTAIGDAIREKTGKTDLLNPTAMPEEIKGITTGDTSGVKKGMLVRRVGSTMFQPTFIDGSATSGRDYPTTSGSYNHYYWYRSSNTNVYWQVAKWSASGFTAGRQYRISFWIWHNGAENDEPVAIWQDKFFVNSNTQTTMPIKEITREPQLVTVTVTYQPDSVYGFSLYLYPEDSGNQVRMTPVVIEDMTNPSTSIQELPL